MLGHAITQLLLFLDDNIKVPSKLNTFLFEYGVYIDTPYTSIHYRIILYPSTHTLMQGRCRSCYAFATSGVLESLHALTTGKLVALSEQNIIDCSGERNHNNIITTGSVTVACCKA